MLPIVLKLKKLISEHRHHIVHLGEIAYFLALFLEKMKNHDEYQFYKFSDDQCAMLNP